jgi:hypothetical protein
MQCCPVARDHRGRPAGAVAYRRKCAHSNAPLAEIIVPARVLQTSNASDRTPARVAVAKSLCLAAGGAAGSAAEGRGIGVNAGLCNTPSRIRNSMVPRNRLAATGSSISWLVPGFSSPYVLALRRETAASSADANGLGK